MWDRRWVDLSRVEIHRMFCESEWGGSRRRFREGRRYLLVDGRCVRLRRDEKVFMGAASGFLGPSLKFDGVIR
jgi:hypothetical protein